MRFEGKNVDDATGKACLALEKTLKELSITVIDTGSKGFLGFGAKPAIIEVSVKGEQKKNLENKKDFTLNKNSIKTKNNSKKTLTEKPLKKEVVKREKDTKPENKEENKKASLKMVEVFKETKADSETSSKVESINIDISDEHIKEVETYIICMLKTMQIDDVKIEVYKDIENKNVNYNIVSEESSRIIGKRGVGLDAIQNIINVVFSEKRGSFWLKVNSDNYREKRRKTIEALAIRSALNVKKYKKKVILDNLNASERRIVHSILQKDNRIDTYSEGREPNRKLIISLKRK